MRLRVTRLALAAVLLAPAVPVLAQVTLIDQLPSPLPSAAGGLFSQTADSDCTFGTPNRALTAADDFVITQAVSVNQVEFLGNYPLDTAPSDPESFAVRFLTNNGSNLPGTLVAQPAITISQTPLFTGSGSSGYDFVASFAPVQLNPGTYWVEIFETDSSTTTCQSWILGPLDATNGRNGYAVDLANAPGTNWSLQSIIPAQQNNLAVKITGQPAAIAAIPTLGPWGLAALSVLLGIAALIVRRSRTAA
ncbi:MAG: IPTL-CTERM sorting domain-containing protein [Acidobacteriota bacterium]